MRGGMLVLALLLAATVEAQPGEGTAADSLKGGKMVYVADFGFYIDKYEVTNAEYAAFLNEAGNRKEEGAYWVELGSKYALIERVEGRFAPKEGFEKHPAVEISWHGARAYCLWAGKRLPGEEEWRRACEGKEQYRFPWGDLYEEGRANLFGDGDGYARTAPVGSFAGGASPCGAMDLAGNVWEWTETKNSELQYLRGGSWVNGKSLARCAARANTRDSHSYIKGNTLGFRCAR